MIGDELHQDRYVSEATTADAGKVTTPSSSEDGVGELRKLKATELSTEQTTTEATHALFQSGTTNDVPEWRRPQPEDVDGYTVAMTFQLADIGTAEAVRGVLPYDATTVQFGVVLYGAITGSNETVRVTIGTATAIDLTVLVAGSGEDVVTLSPVTTLSAAQAAGVKVKVETLGNSTGATKAGVTLWTAS